MAEAVFCQITGRDISTNMCIELQNSHDAHECFGCGACSRLCSACRQRKPVNPEIGLCCACIGQQLTVEKRFKRPGFEKRSRGLILCPIVNKDISHEMCFASQGADGCQACASPFRLCENCQERRVYYAPYGHCLHCALEWHGSRWLRLKTSDLNHVGKLFSNPRTHQTFTDVIVDQVRTFVLASGRASENLFKKKFGLGREKCRALLFLLEIEGVIKNTQRGAMGREIAFTAEKDQSTHVLDLGECEKCCQNPAIIGLNSPRRCFRCFRSEHPKSWGKLLGSSLNRSIIERELLSEAIAIAIEANGIGPSLILRKMSVGRRIAERLIQHMVKEGIVSPHPCGKHRFRASTISKAELRRRSAKEVVPETIKKQCSHCKNRSSITIRLRGLLWCLKCARKHFGYQWTVGFTQSPSRDEVMNILQQEAKIFTQNHLTVSLTALCEHLTVGGRIGRKIMAWLQEEGVVSQVVSSGHSGRVVISEDKKRKGLNPQKLYCLQQANGSNDPLFDHAKLLVISEQKASVEFLRTKLHIGWRRAWSIFRSLEKEKIITAAQNERDFVRNVMVKPSYAQKNSQVSETADNLRELAQLVGNRGYLAQTLHKAASEIEKMQKTIKKHQS